MSYEFSKSVPNKFLNSDGTVSTLQALLGGESNFSSVVDAYKFIKSIPNKFLNPDGSISTLQEIVASSISTDIFIVVEELPVTGEENKIYLVPNESGTFDEYFWTGTEWDRIGELHIDLSNYYTKTETDTNFLKKNNTTSYTPSNDYNPATKKYVDDNCIPYKPFPTGLDTSHTTPDFIASIRVLNLPAGSTYLGGVTLTDMPFNGNAEVEIYVYPGNVIYLVLRSANVSPYMWECNSHTYRGWEAVGKAYADTNFLNKTNTTSYTPTANYHPATKKYVDDSIASSITQALGGDY